MKKLAVVLFLMAFCVPAMAETYTWTDDSGTMNFTEDFGKIPKKYRKKARKVGDESAPPAPVETRETPKQKRADSPADLSPQGNSTAKAEKSQQYGGKSAEEFFANEEANMRKIIESLLKEPGGPAAAPKKGSGTKGKS